MKKFFALSAIFLLFSCAEKQTWVDLVVFNANIYTVDPAFSIKQSMAISNGKIVALGTDDEIKTKYNSSTLLDAEGRAIFPGFIDAHCHFLGYGLGLQRADLTGTRSFDEVLKRLPAPAMDGSASRPWIIGRGWDQNDWEVKEFPTNDKLDSLYPAQPVLLTRIDGHAGLVNQSALDQAGITAKTKVNGGEIVLKNGKPTGVLIDNAVDLVSNAIPKPSKEQLQQALLEAQKNCFAVGLTTVDDAGLMKEDIDLIDELQKADKLQMRVYAMLSDSGPNYRYYLEKGPYKTDKLNVRSFKFYADGALGSRGACLLQDYEDKKGWKGFLLNSIMHFEGRANEMVDKGFQMNTHCIGDSACRLILDIYKDPYRMEEIMNMMRKDPQPLQKKALNNLRWRIEHFQVTTAADIEKLKGSGIVPSVQPTHATSDMYWAEDRLGAERVKYAYAYKDLLRSAGVIALGTDFPVEDISPFKTFYAAVFRKDAKGFPEGGFQVENALTREETIKGMTIWAAYSNFEEKEKGSLEVGKFADFVILDTDLTKCDEKDVLKTKVLYTFLNGQAVYTAKQ